jgi:hypothetical protein
MGQYFETFYPPFFMDRRYAYDAISVNPKGYDRDDEDIVADLRRRFSDLAAIDTSLVQVSSEDEIICLAGPVASERVAKFLGRVAENVLGVRAVSNKLVVARAGALAQINASKIDAGGPPASHHEVPRSDDPPTL